MTKYLFLLSLSLFALIAPCTVQAQAEAPKLLPVQGYLTDAAGKPLDGNVKIRFRLYDTSEPNPANTENVVHEETRTIDVTAGHFTVYLGDDTEQPLSLDIFAQHSVLFVGIKVNSDARELAPLLQLATAPYAGFAQSCGDAASVGGKKAEDVITGAQGDARFARLSQCYWKLQNCAAEECKATCGSGDYVISGGCDGTPGTAGGVVESYPLPSDGNYKDSPNGPWHPGTPATDPKSPLVDSWFCKARAGASITNTYIFCCPGI
jgi:hypothetical protein